jgi:hypothetical protein
MPALIAKSLQLHFRGEALSGSWKAGGGANMRVAVLVAVLLATPIAMARSEPVASEWSMQIPTLKLGPSLTPDTGLEISGYSDSAGGGTGGGGYQFGNNIAAQTGALYATFQKGAFPFRR